MKGKRKKNPGKAPKAGNRRARPNKGPSHARELSLDELIKRKPCHAPFSLHSLIDLAKPCDPETDLSLRDVTRRVRNYSQELLNRVYADHPGAIEDFCSFAQNLVWQLTALEQAKRSKLRDVAESFEEWPVLYAPDATDHVALYQRLGVGTNSFIPRYATRKINYDNLWTQYATGVLRALRWAAKHLPGILGSAGCRKWGQPTTLTVGKTEVSISYYDTTKGVFEIPEWCEWCLDLPDKLRPDNVYQFWRPAKIAILEYWFASEHFEANAGAYRAALKQIGGNDSESKRRNAALDAIKRAMISLAGK